MEATMASELVHTHSEHDHAHHERDTGPAMHGRLLLALALTAAYMVAEIVGGLLTNSLALVADAGHMASDVAGLMIAMVAARLIQRPATSGRTYGLRRAEILAALVNSVALIGIVVFIAWEAVARFWSPPAVNGAGMLVIALGGLLVNLCAAWLLHPGAEHSLNVRGAFLHVLMDILGSVGVLIAGAVILLTGWQAIDPLISLVLAVLILPRAWSLLRTASDVLMESTPAHLDTREIQGALAAVPGVVSVHDLHVWTISSGFIALSGHVIASDAPSSTILHDLQTILRTRFGIQHTTLQLERPDHAEDGTCCEIDPRCLPDEVPVALGARH
jgi:cobalt-zinc-cadmium efflux system protein